MAKKNDKPTAQAAGTAAGSTQPNPQAGNPVENPTPTPTPGNDGDGKQNPAGQENENKGTADVDNSQQGTGTGSEGDKATSAVATPTPTPTPEPVEPKAVKDKRARIAKEVFAKRDTLTVIHFTSDLVPFATDVEAHKHATTLQDKTVTPVTKE